VSEPIDTAEMRLRWGIGPKRTYSVRDDLSDAYDEIDRLREHNQALTEALRAMTTQERAECWMRSDEEVAEWKAALALLAEQP
jgi:hypothetical protein